MYVISHPVAQFIIEQGLYEPEKKYGKQDEPCFSLNAKLKRCKPPQ